MSLASRSPVVWQGPARRVLVLGGTRSGKSAVAEAMVSDAPLVRYVATAVGDDSDPAWVERIEAHRRRRPDGWHTVETGAEPDRLAEVLMAADPAETLVVDDLGCWLTAVLNQAVNWDDPAVAGPASEALAAAVAACPAARLVLVSPEVGLAVVPASRAGRVFSDAQGELNQRIAAVCDAVALVVAGRPLWLTGGARRPVGVRAQAPVAPPPGDGWQALEAERRAAQGSGPPITIPDESVASLAGARLASLDVPGSGLGELAEFVQFAAATRDSAEPAPWRDIRVLLLRGEHEGGVSAGDPPAEVARRFADARRGAGPIATLAAASPGVTVTAVECPPSAAIETSDALSAEAVDAAIAEGHQLAESAIDGGADLIVIASCGNGGAGTAAAITALVCGGEPPTLLPRAVTPGGRVDDEVWMRWCVAVRDALHRIRHRERDPRSLLAMVGGGDVAVATGALLRAATRRTPVLIDGPVGVAAALVAREMAIAAPRWLLLPDHGGQPAIRRAATMLGLTPTFDLKLGLGEGATALATLPLFRAALTIAATVIRDECAEDPAGVADDAAGDTSDAAGDIDEAAGTGADGG